MSEQTEDPDTVLVTTVAARDETTFTVLYRRYLPVVLRWCLVVRPWLVGGDN